MRPSWIEETHAKWVGAEEVDPMQVSGISFTDNSNQLKQPEYGGSEVTSVRGFDNIHIRDRTLYVPSHPLNSLPLTYELSYQWNAVNR